MKKIMIMAVAVTSLVACQENKTTTEIGAGNDTIVKTERDMMDMPGASRDTMIETVTVYTPAEGDVIYRDNTLMVWQNGTYVEAKKDVTLENGMIVKRNGEVVKIKEGRKIQLKEGEAVTKTGNFFDKAGKAIENAWDATKKFAVKAGKAIGDGAEKVGDKVKEAVD